MEGAGFYNRHSLIPSGGGALALPHLERAVAGVPLAPVDEPVVVVDYGSSQGFNSLAPMRLAIESIRRRSGAKRAVLVHHVDQPLNQFNALFELLDVSPERYSLHDPCVFPCAIGRSFYESVLPPNSVHVGWSSYAGMSVRRIPALIPGHFVFQRSTGDVRTAWERQGAEDWETFLSLRARELRPGGCLVVTVTGADERGASAFERVFDQANAELATMVDEGALAAEDRRRMALNVWPRRMSDLVAPFAIDGRFSVFDPEGDRDSPAERFRVGHIREGQRRSKFGDQTCDVLSRSLRAHAGLISGCRSGRRPRRVGHFRRSSDQRPSAPTRGQSGAYQFARTDPRCRQHSLNPRSRRGASAF
jgi:SAM dependent carboxyl methyltransferase